jgi:uncharacterized membrane protein
LKDTSRQVTILLIILLGIALLPTTTIKAETDGNIHGTIVDESGSPLYRVKVSAYLNTGSLVTSKYTNQDGYFRMSLSGSNTLVFEKTGFVTFDKTVQVDQAPTGNPNQDIVKLGNLEMQQTLALTSPVVKRLTPPGTTLLLEFTITNRGDQTENVMFSVAAPTGWDTKVLDSVGEIENILLAPGSAKYNLEISVPETATNVENIVLTANGTSTATLAFTITSKVYSDEIKLKTTYLSISDELGSKVSLPLSVTNLGEVDKQVTLEADVPNSWSISFKASSNMDVKTLLMESGSTEQLTMELEAPDSATVGNYKVIVKALDVNGALLDTLSVDINLRVGTSDIEVISSFSEVSVKAGESITFPLAIWNKGDADSLTLLTVPVLPENWDASFISDDLAISSIRIPSGESESIQLVVNPPNSVVSGTYNLVAVIESADGVQHQTNFTITVLGSYQLAMDLSTLYTSGTIGGTISYTAKVTNQGETAITTLYMQAETPSGWDATITPTQVDTLSPRSSTTFTVTVSIPSNAVAGDYLVTMQALSDQLSSDSSDVRITAQASNTWGYVGIFIALLAVIGAVLLFRRFKRR